MKTVLLYVTLNYSETPDPQEVTELVQNALEHMRQNGCLTNPEVASEISCDSVSCEFTTAY